MFRKMDLNDKPCYAFQTNNKPAVCVRFCPCLFKLDTDTKENLIDLPYKIVFAVATTEGVIIYSTQKMLPIYIVGNLHYATLTDLSWKNDKCLAVSSLDGYCSFIHFQNNILGQIYNYQGL